MRPSVQNRLLTISFLFVFASAGLGQPAPVPARPDPINWIVGPATADLGETAKINIPEGYRFATTEQARQLFKSINQTPPTDLVGILAPAAGRLTIVFEYSEVGYVDSEGRQPLDAAAVLSALRERIQKLTEQNLRPGASAIVSVDWESAPEFDSTEHTLEWSFHAGQSVNHVLCLFGRGGVLKATAVQPRQQLIEPLPLQRLMSGVCFKAGYAYADYRKGDKVYAHSLASLVTSDNSPETGLSREAMPLPLIAAIAGGGVLVCAVAGVVLVRRRRRRKTFEYDTRESAPEAIAAPVPANGAAKPVPGAAVALPQVNGRHNGHSKLRRRRMFNYQKFYSDLLMQVSDRAYEGSLLNRTVRNGADATPAHKPAENGAAEARDGKTTLSANLGLIECQRSLIEEQQQLIREQTKLIEEKTRLIQEKNQVLDKQSELFGNNAF